MEERIFKIGSVELYESTVKKYYEENKYIVTSTAVWQIFYSNAQGQYYGKKVLNQKGMARRGRFYALTGKEVNHVLGKEVLN